MLALAIAGCGGGRTDNDQNVDAELTPAAAIEPREGLAAAILIDVSGSMEERVPSASGERVRKIEVARDAALRLVGQFVAYARDHADQPVRLGIYEFSRREGQPDLRPLIAMGPPDVRNAVAAIAKAVPDGGTPIGSAMIAAKKELDATALSRRHLLVVTDGENTDGVAPQRVAAAIGRRPEAERPSMYFVAFDIDANRFSAVRDNGVLVLEASNGLELSTTLESLLRGKILVEQ
jgi:Mg-chelatase subunit ChlD